MGPREALVRLIQEQVEDQLVALRSGSLSLQSALARAWIEGAVVMRYAPRYGAAIIDALADDQAADGVDPGDAAHAAHIQHDFPITTTEG